MMRRRLLEGFDLDGFKQGVSLCKSKGVPFAEIIELSLIQIEEIVSDYVTDKNKDEFHDYLSDRFADILLLFYNIYKGDDIHASSSCKNDKTS